MNLNFGLGFIALKYSVYYRYYTVAASQTAKVAATNKVLGKEYIIDAMTNTTSQILSKVGKGLHRRQGHPLNIILKQIETYFSKSRPLFISSDATVPLTTSRSLKRNEKDTHTTFQYNIYNNMDPIVTVTQNFDELCFPSDHVGRSSSDTYYLNSEYLLRTHTSAHEVQLLKDPENIGFINVGDVYRRDEIDTVHYPVFHQVEGVRRYSPLEMHYMQHAFSSLKQAEKHDNVKAQPSHDPRIVQIAVQDMKNEIEGIVKALFGSSVEFYWIPGEFPFTFPSFELEILFHGKRVELCGCGILQQSILDHASHKGHLGWAFGFGLERLAMVLFDIPDIRLFWSEDARFYDQFKNKDIKDQITFVPFSKHPPICRDISFWLPEHLPNNGFHHNLIYEIIREEAGDLVENVSLVDEFVHATTRKKSLCYRITYRSMHRSLNDIEINQVQNVIRDKFVSRFNVILR